MGTLKKRQRWQPSMTFRRCAICGERFSRVPGADYRPGQVTSLFCTDCLTTLERGEVPRAAPAIALPAGFGRSGGLYSRSIRT
jgi:hypothetical protein